MSKAARIVWIVIGFAIAGAIAYQWSSGQRTLTKAAITAPGGAGGVVHLRLQSFALMLHPLKLADVESRQVATMLYAGLVVQDQDGETLPAVAENWTQTGNEWEFRLKAGLSFSNGQSLRDEDVVVSLCNAMQPASPWAWALASIAHSPSADGKGIECTGISVTAPGTDRKSVV